MQPKRIDARISHNGMSENLQFATHQRRRYTVLPQSIWRKLKLAPKNGPWVNGKIGAWSLRVSECQVQIGRHTFRTLVILGGKNAAPRLGQLR